MAAAESTPTDQLAEVNRKLDFILAEMEHLRRHRQSMEDLQDDLTIVARDVYQTAVVELEEMSGHVKPGDVAYLLRKLLRNTDNLAKAFEQIESIADFLEDLKPITREVYNDALAKLATCEKKGYFRFAGQVGGMMDAFVGSHSEQDLSQLQRSLPHLIGFLRELTRPEAMQALETIVHGFGEVQASRQENVSLLRLLREMNSPEARRGLHVLVKFLKVIGAGSSPGGAGECLSLETK